MKKLPSVLLFLCLVALVFISFHGCQKGDSSISPQNIFSNSEIFKGTRFDSARRKLPEFDDSPLAKLRQGGKVVLPHKDVLSNMSTTALEDTLHNYLGNIDHLCHRTLRMGKVSDGGWEVCDDEEYRPIRPCLVYSFGIQDDFSFDDYIANNYGCEVFSFDPSMSQDSYQRSKLVMFFKLGIGAEDTRPGGSDWEIYTVKSFKKKFGHSDRPLDVLKMDIEFNEWDTLPQLISSGEIYHVRQLLLEFHTWNHGRSEALKYLNVLKDLYDAGFRKFYTHKNPACYFDKSQKSPVQRTDCYEVHYVNTNFRS